MTSKNEAKKPGYNAPVVRNPNRDMLCSITTIDDIERAVWFHRGKKVFTVTTYADGTMKYESAL